VGETILSGLITGSTLALAALGISLIFGVADIANFAQGPMLAFGAMLGWWLTAVLHLPYALALACVAVATALLGIAIERIALRPLANAPRLAVLLATVAVGIVLDRATQLIFSPETRVLDDPFPRATLAIGGLHVSAFDTAIPAIAAAIALLSAWFLTNTSTGRAIRASAQDPDAARQMGIDVGTMQSIAFALAASLAGIAGMLAGTYYRNVEPSIATSLGMGGFAAAALGGLGSLGGAVVGGLALGVLQNVGATLFGGAALQVVTFATVLGAFWLRSRRASSDRAANESTFFGLPALPAPPRRSLAIVLVLAAVGVPLFCGPYVLRVGSEIAIYATLALSLTLVAGTCGTISLGQVGFFAIGAYASALLEKDLGWTFWCAAPAASAISGVLAAIAISPVARLGGQELAIATFAIGATIVALILNLDSLTNGPLGISNLAPPSAFGHAIVSARDDFLLAASAFAIGLLFVRRLQSSPLGLTWRAIRDDPVAAAASGIAPAAYKTLAFALGGGVAGLAGSVLASQYLYVSPDMFDTDISVLAFTIVVLGGMGSVWGALLGAAVLVGIPELFRPLHDYRILAYGVALLLLVRFRPQGFFAYR